jgi:hypothetical protein
MSLSSFIAKTGQNPDFVAFMAHSGFAYFVVHQGFPWWAAVVLAAFKEVIFDPAYEVNQTVWPDGALDFSGYAAGIALGVFLH